jgi:peptidoglycan/xylan/chitin deacetylase (PgdA/CDA1 family)
VTGARVPILMYHEVTPHPEPAFARYTVTARAFARQMRWLAAFNYRPVDMDTLMRARLGLERLPHRAVVISFDDGLQGCVDHAVPVLREHGFTAVFYLVAGLMGDRTAWLRQELGIDLPIMSWDTARRLAADGFQCGAHTLTHPRLAGLEPAQVRRELAEGRQRLEDQLDGPVLHLAYPFGSFDAAVRREAEDAGYLTACSTRAGLSGPEDDLLALQRVPIYGGETLLDFAWRVRTARSLPVRVRRALRAAARRLTRSREART